MIRVVTETYNADSGLAKADVENVDNILDKLKLSVEVWLDDTAGGID